MGICCRRPLLADRHAPPQFVGEVLEHDDPVVLLRGLGGNLRNQHGDALAVWSEIPRGTGRVGEAECRDPLIVRRLERLGDLLRDSKRAMRSGCDATASGRILSAT